MAYTRTHTKKRGTKRYRNGKFVSARRPYTRTIARFKRRRGSVRKVNNLSARAYFDASRWHHRPDLSVPDQISEYTPVRGVHRTSITAPTGAGGSAMYVFVWTPSVCRSMWITHNRNDSMKEYFNVDFPVVASHSSSAGPAMVRPLRQSVAIRNISASQDVSGVVRVLSTNHPLAWVLTYQGGADHGHVLIHQDEHANLVKMIDQHPSTRR